MKLVQSQISSVATREYFYHYNEHGKLYFIYDTVSMLSHMTSSSACGKWKWPSGPTFLKDEKFLKFFANNLRVNSEYIIQRNESNYHSLFPYVSKCGNEYNYIHCEVPFIDLKTSRGTSAQGSDCTRML